MIAPLAFRSLAYAPFHIPSSSMKSTLLIGDYIFVAKYAYGYSRYSFPFGIGLFDGRAAYTPPRRGDIAVFRPSSMPRIDYIKRVIGLPGDRIQMRGGVLHLNGKPVPRARAETFPDIQPDGSVKMIPRYMETLPEGVRYYVLDEDPAGRLDNTPVYTVPEGHYFMMGDNRDNSQDSRVLDHVGYVPAENLVGRAEVVFFSTATPLWKFWLWPSGMRGERFLKPMQEFSPGEAGL